MAIDAIFGILALFLLVALLEGPWQWVWTDTARQSVFEKRDAIFDLAAAGKISFKSKEYRVIRRSMEKLIRYSHNLTLWKLIHFLWTMTKRKSPPTSDISFAIKSIGDDNVRLEVQTIVNSAVKQMFLMMIRKSLILMLLFGMFRLVVLIYPAVAGPVFKAYRTAREFLQAEAEHAENAV